MCGIFGAIGEYEKDKLKILAIMNESRGKDSFGIYRRPFNKSIGAIYKAVEKSTDMMSDRKMNMYFKASKGVFLGHTRYATRGNKSLVRNAHPFQYGNIIGTHNGIIQNVDELEELTGEAFEVDSQAIFWLLNEREKDKEVFKELRGYWGLAWVNTKDPTSLYLTRYNNTLYYAKIDNKAVYYSSDENHLKLITGGRYDKEIKSVAENQVLRITKDLKFYLGKKYDTKKYVYNYLTNTNPKKEEDTYYVGGYNYTPTYLNPGSEVVDLWDSDDCEYCGVDILETATKEVFYYEDTMLCRDCAKYMLQEFNYPVFTEFGDRVYKKDFEREVK